METRDSSSKLLTPIFAAYGHRLISYTLYTYFMYVNKKFVLVGVFSGIKQSFLFFFYCSFPSLVVH